MSGYALPSWADALAATRKVGWGIASVTKAKDGRNIARLATPSPLVACDPTRMIVTNVVVTAAPDQQEDVIEPSGGKLDEHERNPIVYYEHAQAEYGLPIAKSINAAGDYSVRLVGGVLIADTQFNQKDKFSTHLFQLVEGDFLRGWSVGMDPNPGGYEPIGPVIKSLGRRAMRFHDWKMIEYSLTPRPVNAEALTILVEKGRLGSEPIHPAILKSLTPYALKTKSVSLAPSLPKVTSMAVRKAMTDDPNAYATDSVAPAEPTADAPEPETTGGVDMKPTPRSFYDLAQGILDIVDQCRMTMESGEHLGGRKKFDGYADKLEALAETIKADGDKIADQLDTGDEKPGDTADDAEPDADTDDAADGLNTDDEGGIVTKSFYKPKRWTTTDVKKAGGTTALDKPTKRTEEEKLLRRLSQLEKRLGGV